MERKSVAYLSQIALMNESLARCAVGRGREHIDSSTVEPRIQALAGRQMSTRYFRTDHCFEDHASAARRGVLRTFDVAESESEARAAPAIPPAAVIA